MKEIRKKPKIQNEGKTNKGRLELLRVTTDRQEETMSCAPCGISPCICGPGKVHM